MNNALFHQIGCERSCEVKYKRNSGVHFAHRATGFTRFDLRFTTNSITRKRFGFTLLEVLVVIAVITLLLAILMPSLRAARDAAKRSACATNLHQIANATHAYLNESGDRFPQGPNMNYNFGGCMGAAGWEYRLSKPLNPLLGIESILKLADRTSAIIFLCPADDGGGEATSTTYHSYGTSYLTNPLLIGPSQINIEGGGLGACEPVFAGANRLLPDLTRSRVTQEPKLLLIGDHGWTREWWPSIADRIEWHRKERTHNLAFMDGHVQFLRIRKGLHVTPEYHVMPFDTLIGPSNACQQEVP